jgi:hypothetical protein
LGHLVLPPIRHAQGHARIEKHHSWWRVGLMDGTKSLRSIYYQLHTVGRCMHLNARAEQSQRNIILGLKTYVQRLLAMVYYLCLL